jgi:hypothetical protein
METPRRTKLPHLVIVRSPGLLPMQYTLREMCEEQLASGWCTAPTGYPGSPVG